MYDYIFDLQRGAGLYLLPLPDEATVLDLGCGFGTLSVSLSGRCKEVYAIDSVFERVKFVDFRRTFEQRMNIQPVMADILHLPFPTNSFDVVIMNGALEWVGLAVENIDPLEVQKRVLHDIHHLLKENGYIYIAIENRYGLDYILGNSDHGGLLFTSLLPRRMANIYSKAVNGTNYRTYTHSCGLYKKILEDCGFCDVQIYVAFPTYRTPHAITAIENPYILKYYLKNIYPKINTTHTPRTILGKLLKPIQKQVGLKALKVVCSVNLLEYFASHLIITARKGHVTSEFELSIHKKQQDSIISKLISHMLENWDSFSLQRPKPKRVSFLQLSGDSFKSDEVVWLLFVDEEKEPLLAAKMQGGNEHISWHTML